MSDTLLQKLNALYGMRLHAPRSSLDDRSDYRTLLTRLGNPHFHIPPAIHVAGTNGKGSTLAFLKAMYEAEGYKTHVYTSPHLIRFNERIVLAGSEISDDNLEILLDEIMAESSGLQLTFFEIATALAFLAFTRTPADISLIETGMGGRIDCTNVISRPLATIITRISLDHRQYLGQTIQEIATEKAGIMKPDAPCIIGYQHEASGASASHDSETLPFDSIAGQIDTPLHRAGREWSVSKAESDPSHFIFRYGSLQYRCPVPSLVGAHQIENAGAALACTHVIDSFPIQAESRLAGLTRVRWIARLQRLSDHPLQALLPAGWDLWLDGGHNDSAGQVLAHQAQVWHARDARPLHMIMGMKHDKEAGLFLDPLLPHLASLTVVPIPGMNAGSYSAQEVAAAIKEQRPGLSIRAAESVEEVIRQWRQGPPISARVLIAGSLYLAGAVLEQSQAEHARHRISG